MRPLLVAASVWPAAPPRHHVLVAATDGDGRGLWTGADDGGIVRWVLKNKSDDEGGGTRTVTRLTLMGKMSLQSVISKIKSSYFEAI